MGTRSLVTAGALAGLGMVGYGSGFAQVAWHQVLGFIALQGKPVAASPARISEHEVQELDHMAPQQQAQLLLERAMNHYEGATELIDKRVDSWRGSVEMKGQLNTLFTSALNSNDLRVRAAAIEIDLAAYNVEKTRESVDSRIQSLESGEGDRITALWLLGLLGNRGVEPDRVFQTLLKYTRPGYAHPPLGCRGPGLPGNRRHHRAASRDFSYRPVREHSREGGVQTGAIRNAATVPENEGGAGVPESPGGLVARRGGASVGDTSLARYQRAEDRRRPSGVATLV